MVSVIFCVVSVWLVMEPCVKFGTTGTAGSLAGTITSGHAITLTAGGAGTSATGQFVTEITVID